VLTVEETAAEWKVTPATVREWVRTDKLPVGVSARWLGRLMRFDEQEVKNAGKGKPCPSTDIQSPVIGGFASRSLVERFAEQRERRIERRQKNTNTRSVLVTGVRFGSMKNTGGGRKPPKDGSGSGPESAA
jgi:hypothetical protein